MEQRQVVILGWDGLDYELLQRWGLESCFGESVKKLETFSNPQMGVPHTREVWPSIITGVRPEEHGIWASNPTGDVDWDDSKLTLASNIGQYIVPQTVRTKIGQYLLDRGVERNQFNKDHYAENGLSTLFDERASQSISVPNYRVPLDDEYDLSFYRKATFSEIMDVIDTDDGRSLKQPLVSKQVIDRKLKLTLHKRLALLQNAIERQNELIFCWFGYIDTVGHLSPMIEEPGYQRRHYEVAARVTESIRASLGDSDVLICLSDHGLRDGKHTDSAVICADDVGFLTDVSAVFDVKDAIDSHYPPIGGDNQGIRDEFVAGVEREKVRQSTSDVRENLEDLGYI